MTSDENAYSRRMLAACATGMVAIVLWCIAADYMGVW